MKRLLLVVLLSLTLTSCKTQEDIRREKTVESLNEQVAQTQKSTANANSRFNTLEEQMAKITGQLEESTHSRQQEIRDFALLKERLAAMEETNKKQTEYMTALNDKIQEQTSYIEQVIKSLSDLNEEKVQASKKKEPKSETAKVASIKSGIAEYKARDYDAAKSIFLEVLDKKNLKGKDKESALHYLAQIEYKNKNYESAKVYFSKLFSENPESSFGASTLLGLAKSFIQLKSKEEAAQSIDELVARFPKSKEAQEGAKLKAKL